MTSREELIEEAAKAILDAAETPVYIRDEQIREWARRDARAAVAVFEKAHTPTNDERECGFMGCGAPRCEAMCSPEPQGEPSDAQVRAAKEALGHGGASVTTPMMRAALRAAGGVR